MINFLKKSIRAKISAAIFFIALVPLAVMSVFLYFTSKDAMFRNVYKELTWNVNEASSQIDRLFHETGKDLVLASQNVAFKMYFFDKEHKDKWLGEQKKTLKHLRSIYPDMLDEACFIRADGQELSRIIFDKLADENELSSGEDRSHFFKEAFKVKEEEVFHGEPVISEDTGRWVLPAATPIVVNGKKAAILHFEVSMAHFQRLLKKIINPDRGYAFVINDKGEFLARTDMNIGENEPFPKAVSPDTPAGLAEIYKKIVAGGKGIDQFSFNGNDYYVSYRPVDAGFEDRLNENKWSIAYVLSSDRIYVEFSIIRYTILAMAVIILLVLILTYFVGEYVTKPVRELAHATGKVAAGEMPSFEVKSDDEIGQLSKAFRTMAEAVKRRDEALRGLAVTDGLTGIYNHRHFKDELEKAVKAARRFKRPLSLLMADIDFFKNYNDAHGHTYGDAALRKVAELFSKNLREVDIAARYGGEEFAMILPETGLKDALAAAERIRLRIKEEPFPFEEQQPNGDLTISIGAAELGEGVEPLEGAEPPQGAQPLQGATDAISLINAADKALYSAKENGRDIVWPKV
ncbi:MAG: diguanylate cyclase [Deltaproteobacteria bacterium]|nr:diguanylate cyclase [Deltaproteobacteria bacterium]